MKLIIHVRLSMFRFQNLKVYGYSTLYKYQLSLMNPRD